ncbi:MAG TPA: hypothetical protein VF270_00555 [Ignavibacteriaceae bacterium]
MNDEEKTYKKLLDDLKNLPKIDAPKNFETELLRKINLSGYEKKESFWSKLISPGKLAPAAIAIASAAIIFFVVDINSNEIEDPLNIAPRLREDLVVVKSLDEIPVQPQEESKREKKQSNAAEEKVIETKENETPEKSNVVIKDGSEVNSKGIEKSLKDEMISGKPDEDNLKSEESGSLGGNTVPSATTLASEISRTDSFEREIKKVQNEIQNLPVVKSSSENVNKDNINFMQRNLSSEEKREVQQLKMKVQTEKSTKIDQKQNK